MPAPATPVMTLNLLPADILDRWPKPDAGPAKVEDELEVDSDPVLFPVVMVAVVLPE